MHLCANYQIIPTNTDKDENMKMMQFNQGMFLDMNNQMQMGIAQENTDFNTATNLNRNVNNFHMATKNIGLIPSLNQIVGYPYGIPSGMNFNMNMGMDVNANNFSNINKFGNIYDSATNNINNNIGAGFPSGINNISNNKAQLASENTVTTYTNINYDKKNADKNAYNKKTRNEN